VHYGVRKADTTGKHSSIAKITRPVLAGILPRKRLFERLNESRDRPIGKLFGGIHFSAISKASDRIKKEITADKKLSKLVNELNSYFNRLLKNSSKNYSF